MMDSSWSRFILGWGSLTGHHGYKTPWIRHHSLYQTLLAGHSGRFLLWIANQLVTHSSLGVPELSAPQCWNKWPLKAIYYHNTAQEGRLCCEYKHLSQHQFKHKLLSTRPGRRQAKVFHPHRTHWRSRHIWFCSETVPRAFQRLEQKLSKHQRQHRHWLSWTQYGHLQYKGVGTEAGSQQMKATELLSWEETQLVRDGSNLAKLYSVFITSGGESEETNLRKYPPHHHQLRPGPFITPAPTRTAGRMETSLNNSFHVVYSKFWPCQLHVAAQFSHVFCLLLQFRSVAFLYFADRRGTQCRLLLLGHVVQTRFGLMRAFISVILSVVLKC